MSRTNESGIARCAICRRALTGRHISDFWGNCYCEHHLAEFPSCPFCYRLVTPDLAAPDVDVRCCRICRATAVTDLSTARTRFAEAHAGLRRTGVIVQDASLVLKLSGLGELQRMIGTDRGVPFGVTRTLVSSDRPPSISVTMLSGLPEVMFGGSCVHELGHAWLQLHGVRILPPVEEEGFCELLAWRHYLAVPGPEGRYHAARIERCEDPIYGVGFRRVSEIAKRIGFGQFINALAFHRRMPS